MTNYETIQIAEQAIEQQLLEWLLDDSKNFTQFHKIFMVNEIKFKFEYIFGGIYFRL